MVDKKDVNDAENSNHEQQPEVATEPMDVQEVGDKQTEKKHFFLNCDWGRKSKDREIYFVLFVTLYANTLCLTFQCF